MKRDNDLTLSVMRDSVQHGGNQAAKLRRALQMQLSIQREGLSLQDHMDAFAILLSWQGKRMYVDDMEWIPPRANEQPHLTHNHHASQP